MDEIVSEVRELVLFNKLGGEVSVTKTDAGMVITMSDLLLFSAGGTQLSPKGLKFLEKVAAVLSKLAYHVKGPGAYRFRPHYVIHLSTQLGTVFGGPLLLRACW